MMHDQLYACRGNVSFQVGDATQLQLEQGAYDVVFSNWLLMYLSDEECSKLATDALTWVRPAWRAAQLADV